jgi:predicted RNase H-like HicB family nuclease
MTREDFDSLLDKARYERIEDSEPYYGEIPGIQGVWATGVTLDECRWNLSQSLKDWFEFKSA